MEPVERYMRLASYIASGPEVKYLCRHLVGQNIVKKQIFWDIPLRNGLLLFICPSVGQRQTLLCTMIVYDTNRRIHRLQSERIKFHTKLSTMRAIEMQWRAVGHLVDQIFIIFSAYTTYTYRRSVANEHLRISMKAWWWMILYVNGIACLCWPIFVYSASGLSGSLVAYVPAFSFIGRTWCFRYKT